MSVAPQDDTAASPEPEPLLRMRGIIKTFPGVRALDGVDLVVRPGEVHCLLGQNGAGKSTLIKTLAGAHQPTEGEILVDGVRARQHLDQRGLAGSVLAEEAVHLARSYDEIDTVEGTHARDLLDDAAHLEQGM